MLFHAKLMCDSMWNDFRALHSNLQQLPTRQIDSPPLHNLGACPVVFQPHPTGRSLVPSLSLSYWNPVIVTIKMPIIISSPTSHPCHWLSSAHSLHKPTCKLSWPPGEAQ